MPGSRSGIKGSHSVAPISTPSMPAIATISPTPDSSISVRPSASNTNSLDTLAGGSGVSRSSDQAETRSPIFSRPRSTRPMPSLPR